MEQSLPEGCSKGSSKAENNVQQAIWRSILIHGRLLSTLSKDAPISRNITEITYYGSVTKSSPHEIRTNNLSCYEGNLSHYEGKPSHYEKNISHYEENISHHEENISHHEENLSHHEENLPHCEGQEGPTLHVYGRRIWILIIYCLAAMWNNFQTVKYAAATDILTCYYGVSNTSVNWTVMIYMVIDIILVFPSMWFLDRYGIRCTVLLGSFLNTLCTLIECVASNSTDFPIVMAAQAVSALALPLLLPIPSSLANTWFKSTEICCASGIATIGFQIGGGLAFIITPFFLSSTCSETELIRHGLNHESYFIAGCNLVIFLLLLLTFEDKPPIPPNLAQAVKSKKNEYKKSIKRLLKNFDFDLLLIVYGIIIGYFYTINVLINEMLIPLYPDSRDEIGWAVQLAYLSGAIGMVISGYILDRTHKFREVSIVISCLTTASVSIFIGVLYVENKWLIYFTILLIGLFAMCYVSVGFELACEIVYPESEGSSSGLLTASTMIFTIILTRSGSAMLGSYGIIYCNILFCAVLLLCSIIVLFIKCDCKRTRRNMTTDENQKDRENSSSKIPTTADDMKDNKVF